MDILCLEPSWTLPYVLPFTGVNLYPFPIINHTMSIAEGTLGNPPNLQLVSEVKAVLETVTFKFIFCPNSLQRYLIGKEFGGRKSMFKGRVCDLPDV